MSKSILIALMCLGVASIFQVALAFYDMEYSSRPLLGLSVRLVIDGLLALGIIRGNQLAWRVARFLALVGSLLALSTLAFFWHGVTSPAYCHGCSPCGWIVYVARKSRCAGAF